MHHVARTPLSRETGHMPGPALFAPLGLAVAAALLAGVLLALWAPRLAPAWLAVASGAVGVILWADVHRGGFGLLRRRTQLARGLRRLVGTRSVGV